MAAHEVFGRFQAVPAIPAEGFLADSFLGTIYRREFNVAAVDGSPRFPPLVDEEYFEWIDLLTAVLHAKDQFTFFELGAGFGRWSIRAAAAARQAAIKKYQLCCVEADPVHFEWLIQTLVDNGIDPSKHQLIRAAVAPQSGTSRFRGSASDPGGQFSAGAFYGQALAADPSGGIESRLRALADSTYRRLAGKPTPPVIAVNTITLAQLLEPFSTVDLIDCDVQGAEAAVISSSLPELTRKVKRLHIGTHSSKVERDLKNALSRAGWKCIASYQCGSRAETPFGTINFQDGVQTWINRGDDSEILGP